MTLFVLKLLAVLTMLIDHTGLLFFPDHQIFRIIGRLTFPIFAWGIANGYRHTSNAKKYVYRLLILAVISQVPYSYIYGMLYGMPWRMNIFVTLAMGLVTIMLYERFRSERFFQVLSMLSMGTLSLLFPIDYGLYGLVLILLFHITYGRTDAMILWQSVWIFVFIETVYRYVYLLPLSIFHYLSFPSSLQYYSLLALPLIALYSYKKGFAKYTWWFYWFYPVHLVVLFVIYLFG